MTLRVLYSLVPSLCNIVAIVIACAYPINGKVHGEIRKAIAQRKAGMLVTNPLKPEQELV
jgi:Na+/melibiose symporter-like transporter